MDKPQEALTEISCPPDCGFTVRSHDKEEVISLAKQHVEKKHPGKKVTTDQLRSMAKKV